MLVNLPVEILQHIAFVLIAHQPLGPPSALVPLLCTSKTFHDALNVHDLLARICDLQFDHLAIERRCFKPLAADKAEQLKHYWRFLRSVAVAVQDPGCTTLSFDQTDPGDDTVDLLVVGYLMMLENDGKNYAQLEKAGMYTFVARFLRQKMWAGRERNAGWPIDLPQNGYALMLLWMMTTQAKLDAETLEERNEIILCLLPFVLCPHRYSAAEAPPNHFSLPLSADNPSHQVPISLRTADSPYAPAYPHYLRPDRVSATWHWRTRINISPPLSTIAAKLLYAARKELTPVGVPSHLPAAPTQGYTGLTQLDFAELNSGKTAKLPRGACWDWEKGKVCRAEPGASSGAGDAVQWEESKLWDSEFWRKVLCSDFQSPKPRFVPGNVYDLGSMRGNWQGRIYTPAGTAFAELLRSPIYPGVPDENHPLLFTEQSLQMTMQPVFFAIEEHHRVCGCKTVCPHANEDANDANHEQDKEEDGMDVDVDRSTPFSRPQPHGITDEWQGCGIIPIPPLIKHNIPILTRRAILEYNPHIWHDFIPEPPHAELVSVDQTNEERPEDIPHPGPDAEAVNISGLKPELIDYGMSNSWFPGKLGGVKWAQRKALGAKGDTSLGRRDEVVFGLDYASPNPGAKAFCRAFDEDEEDMVSFNLLDSTLASSSTHSNTKAKLNQYYASPASASTSKFDAESAPTRYPTRLPPGSGPFVYETFHPEKLSMHEVSCSKARCRRCKERAEEMRKERGRAEEEARRCLEGVMKTFGGEEGPEGGMELDELDLRSFGFDFSGVDEILKGKRKSKGAGGKASSPAAAPGKRKRGLDVDEDVDADGPFHPCKTGSRSPGSTKRKHLSADGDAFSSVSSSSSSLSLSAVAVEEAKGEETQEEALPRQLQVLGDDDPYGVAQHDTNSQSPAQSQRSSPHVSPRKVDGIRPVYDRPRVGVACTGVRDIILTGETQGRHALWQYATLYGRVRPWDGLVGILRTVYRPQPEFTFVYGYVVGGQTFVGEWRFAATQPWKPTWGGPFVMSRKEEPQ